MLSINLSFYQLLQENLYTVLFVLYSVHTWTESSYNCTTSTSGLAFLSFTVLLHTTVVIKPWLIISSKTLFKVQEEISF